MCFPRATFILPFLPVLAFGQLTTDQKLLEFNYLADLYAKRYGPYEWKKQQGFDLLDLAPWLAKVRATRTDLEFLDLASEYVSRLNDGHASYFNASDFIARLNFTVDIFDGKLLVDFVNRNRLPTAEYGFIIGYELVSIDGVPAAELLEKFKRYQIAANERSTRRFAAQLLTIRPQLIYAFSPDVPEISNVVFRRPDGRTESYRIPWTKTGIPLTSLGKFPGFAARTANGPVYGDMPDYMAPLLRLQHTRLPERSVVGYGALTPSFVNAMGPGFTVRLGRSPADPFYSGVFIVGNYRVGFIRIPTFAPASLGFAEATFRSEIAFLQANTDSLIVDITRNPGGYAFYVNLLLSYLMPNKWDSVAFEVRATSSWILDISRALESARAQGAPAATIAQIEQIRDALQEANRTPRGMTRPIPIDEFTIERQPARSANGTLLAYTKPLMLLIDELSASGGDSFAATIQDNGRGPLFGFRTLGAGGSVTDFQAGSYSWSVAYVTESLMYRSKDVVTPDFQTTRYVENVGVRPDIEFDYMTRSNLVRNGGDFVDAFLLAMYQMLEGTR